MSLLTMSRWELPLRAVTGAFILNSGLNKRDMPREQAEGLHGFAQTAQVPGLDQLEPTTFSKLLSATEIGLGAALLAPVVPRQVAGLGLSGFSAGLLRLYWKAPGMRQEGDVRPTEQGTGMAKDLWMLGIGLSLLLASERGKADRKRKAAAKPSRSKR
ncbi:hypothetical protein ER308_02715 [Egibacter rhizosphaerae]|uniref:DoxX family membrane protein n=1 Tax=Egibacter rhizosphaerae TaxID=1670831 RepID=A0A411YBF2_9ACTN|nr:hypothetical protein [Egibacter rhizosphaerae]QBI18583.1 hypothetical protein ER308_02715 [Egibacter rhizosphaerae]